MHSKVGQPTSNPDSRYPVIEKPQINPVNKTTCGARFRCNKNSEEIKRLYCGLCSGQKTHVMEGRPIAEPMLTKRGITLLPAQGRSSTSGDGSFPADIKCATKNAAVTCYQYREDDTLTQLSRQLEVTCATKVLTDQGESECGQSLYLSELPGHYKQAHRTLPCTHPLRSEQTHEIGSLYRLADQGSYLWPIDLYKQRFDDAVDGQTTSFYSPPFFSEKNNKGYKLCLRLYPNGDGCGKGEYLSLFFVLMKGINDNHLPWPFKESLRFEVLGKAGKVLHHQTINFDAEQNIPDLHQPVEAMSPAFGIPRFISLNRMTRMILHDYLFIRIKIGNKWCESTPEQKH